MAGDGGCDDKDMDIASAAAAPGAARTGGACWAGDTDLAGACCAKTLVEAPKEGVGDT